MLFDYAERVIGVDVADDHDRREIWPDRRVVIGVDVAQREILNALFCGGALDGIVLRVERGIKTLLGNVFGRLTQARDSIGDRGANEREACRGKRRLQLVLRKKRHTTIEASRRHAQGER